jgi:hypothetical protein
MPSARKARRASASRDGDALTGCERRSGLLAVLVAFAFGLLADFRCDAFAVITVSLAVAATDGLVNLWANLRNSDAFPGSVGYFTLARIGIAPQVPVALNAGEAAANFAELCGFRYYAGCGKGGGCDKGQEQNKIAIHVRILFLKMPPEITP